MEHCGTLDVSSSYAGIIGKNISGVEIYVFNGKSISSSIGNLSGGKVASTLSYIDEDSNWHSFTSTASSVHINGIKLKPTRISHITFYKGLGMKENHTIILLLKALKMTMQDIRVALCSY